MHTGPASRRGADFFGASVNLAARIAAFAGGGEVVLSAAVREAGVPEGVRLVALGQQRLRHSAEPVDLYAAQRHATRARLARALDPVCRMAVVPGREARRIRYVDTDYVFCSADCADRFAAQPEAYTAGRPEL